MAFFEGKDCLTPVDKVGKITIKEGVSQDALYTFCIPTFKRKKDLKEALDSVFSQQTDIPFNVIVSDNNPERDDETEALIHARYSNKDNFFYFKNAENLGMADNWNRLVRECPTKYMILFHDDDVLFPFFLERVDAIRRQHPEVSALNTGKVKGPQTIIRDNLKRTGRIYKHTAKNNYSKYLFGAPSGCLFNISDLEEVGGFDADTYPSIDYVCIEKLCLAGKQVLTTSEELMFYRVGENATAKFETQLKWLDVDYQIKTELKKHLGISNIVYKTSLWFEIKMRLRGIKNLETSIMYLGYKPGSKIFCLLYGLYARFLKIRIKVVD